MIINLFVFPIILVLAFAFGGDNTDKNRKWFIIIVSLIILLINSLKSMSVGPDTPSYYSRFLLIQQTSWQEVWNAFLFRYGTLSGDFDQGYNVLQKFISVFTSDFHVFTFIAQLLFFVPFGLLLYKYCKDFFQLTFAFVLYVSLFNSLAFSNARQVYAIGMGICSFLSLSNGKTWKSVLFVIIGYFFHQSCLLCLIPIIMRYIPHKGIRVTTYLAFLAVPFVLVNVNSIILFMGNMVENERYVLYGLHESEGGAIVYISLSLIMALIVSLALRKDFIQDSLERHCLYNMILPTIVFCPLIYSNGSMIRITIFFQLYFCILFAHAMDVIGGVSRRKLIYLVVIILLMVLSVSTSGTYHFFWQENQEQFMINRSY